MRQRGAVLLLVMWLVLLLAALVAGYAASARIESMQGHGAVRDTVAGQAARAGIEVAVMHLLEPDPARRWHADGRGYQLAFDGIPLEVSVRDEAGKVDLNAAGHALLMALFTTLGESPAEAGRLAGAIIDWRDEDSLVQPAGGAEDADYAAAGLGWGAKDAPFESVSELAHVLGMRSGLAAAVAPYLTIYSGAAVPDMHGADDLVLSAMGVERPRPLDPDAVPLAGSGTYSIDSTARLADGRRARVSVILRLGGNGLPGSAYTPLRWQDGVASP